MHLPYSKRLCIVIPALLIAVVAASCNNTPQANASAHKDSVAVATGIKQDTTATTNDATDVDTVTLFMTVADTGQDYYQLRKTMFLLHKKAFIAIDTMNRYYNARKNELCCLRQMTTRCTGALIFQEDFRAKA